MSDLFGSPEAIGKDSPLADRMRPRTLDEVVGQDHIVGRGRLLRRSIQADRISSIILYGPPGTGKTSLARVVANTTKSAFESLNAVLTGVKDVREAIDRATERRKLYGKRTILFVDEVHRWNKAQQDALLPWVENGTIVLIGATTENPFFEVNRALVSRSRIFQLTALDSADLFETARRALADVERGYGRWRVEFEEGALEHLVETANGDARSLLNALELAIETSPDKWPPKEGSLVKVSFGAAEESIQKKAVLYDRDGDYHYDTISAFIKSVRGSDPDAALYWMAKMVRAGESPDFIFRRMLISASEDVGLADPNALVVVQACAATFDRIGLPEGHFPLAQAALYLATAPKSNTALAFFDALKAVEKEDAETPNHLRDDHRDKEGFGHGDGYIYPHAYREHWAAQQYLPASLTGRVFYVPSEIGYEARIRDEVLRKREIQAAVVLSEAEESQGEILTYSAAAKGREGWLKRLEAGRAAMLLKDRDALFEAASPLRHHRILAATADDGLLLWEAVRRAPEGLAAGLVRDERAKDALERYAEALDETERPILAVRQSDKSELLMPAEADAAFGTGDFDFLVAREPWKRGFGAQPAAAAFASYALSAFELLAPGGVVSLLQTIPRRGERISRLLSISDLCETALIAELTEAEDAFYASNADQRLGWDAEDLENAFKAAGFETTLRLQTDAEDRIVGPKEIELWFDAERSGWGAAIKAALDEGLIGVLKNALTALAERGPLAWRRSAALLKARRPASGTRG